MSNGLILSAVNDGFGKALNGRVETEFDDGSVLIGLDEGRVELGVNFDSSIGLFTFSKVLVNELGLKSQPELYVLLLYWPGTYDEVVPIEAYAPPDDGIYLELVNGVDDLVTPNFALLSSFWSHSIISLLFLIVSSECFNYYVSSYCLDSILVISNSFFSTVYHISSRSHITLFFSSTMF